MSGTEVLNTNQYAATGFTNAMVSAGSDDVSGHYIDCFQGVSLPEAYLGRCYTGHDLHTGFRFLNLPLPKLDYISSARLVFQVDGPYTDTISIQLHGEKQANPGPFIEGNESTMPQFRPRTRNSALWTVSNAWDWRETRETPELRDIVQEIIDETPWEEGSNSLVMLAKPNSRFAQTTHRRVMAWERDPAFYPARLMVTRFGNNPPVADAGPDRRYFAVGEWVELGGTGSHDPDGGELSNEWKQVLGPAPVNLFGADQPRARFRVPARGVYLFQLTVTDIGRTDNGLPFAYLKAGQLTDTAEVMVYCISCPL